MTNEPPAIGPGCRVMMHYAIRLEDGTVAEASEEDEPLQFVVGDGTLVRGLEFALYGLRRGEKQRLTIEPEAAFGLSDPANIHPIPRQDFPPQMELAVGVIISFTTPAGDEFPGMIVALEDSQAQVDFNHPLAGRRLDFAVEILSVAS